MSLLRVRCVWCALVALTCLCGLWSVNAYAAVGRQEISPEFWVGLAATAMFGLLSAYVQGIKSALEKRLASLEFDYRQQGTELNLIRSTLLAQYPTKEETAEHRERVEEELRYIRTRIDEVARRR